MELCPAKLSMVTSCSSAKDHFLTVPGVTRTICQPLPACAFGVLTLESFGVGELHF